MDSVYGIDPDLELPPVHAMIGGRPASWLGCPLTWLSEPSDPVPVYIARFRGAVGGRDLETLLFGARCRLRQRGGVAYTESEEERYTPRARVVSDPEHHSLSRPPAWLDPVDAEWPTVDGEPMTFVDQVELPETEVTRTRLTWNTTVYLFWAAHGSDDVFKVVDQEPR